MKSKWGEILGEFEVRMQKTSKTVRCQLSDDAQDALERWFHVSGKENDDFIFTSVRGGKKPITSVAYRKIIRKWCLECGWNPEYFSTHSLRRSLPSFLFPDKGHSFLSVVWDTNHQRIRHCILASKNKMHSH